MLGSILALIQCLVKGMHLGVQKGTFVLLSYMGLGLDRRMVQSSNLVHLESDVGAIK